MLFTRSAGIAVAAMLLAASGGIALSWGRRVRQVRRKREKPSRRRPLPSVNRNPEHRCGRIIVQHVEGLLCSMSRHVGQR